MQTRSEGGPVAPKPQRIVPLSNPNPLAALYKPASTGQRAFTGRVDHPQNAPAAAPVLQGGGGGGGGAAMATAAANPLSLQDYITGNYLYNSSNNENGRLLQDFDSETLRKQQEVEADQGLRRTTLQQQLADMGRESAGGLASRGLLRSGLNFQAQDKINQFGVQQENGIAQILTSLLSDRTAGRLQQEQQNRARMNDIINGLTGQFNQQNLASVGG